MGQAMLAIGPCIFCSVHKLALSRMLEISDWTLSGLLQPNVVTMTLAKLSETIFCAEHAGLQLGKRKSTINAMNPFFIQREYHA